MADSLTDGAPLLDICGQVFVLAGEKYSLTRLSLRAQPPTVMKVSTALAPSGLHVSLETSLLRNYELVNLARLEPIFRHQFLTFVYLLHG